MTTRLILIALAVCLPLAAVHADETTVPELVRQLGDRAWKTRDAATRALIRRGPTVLPELEKAIADADSEVAERLRIVIASIGKAQAAALAARVEKEHKANLAHYKKVLATLHAKHKGAWVVIANGATAGIGKTFEAALKTCARSTEGAAHRFVFCVGSEPKLGAAPVGHGSLRCGDVGMGLKLPFDLMVSAKGTYYLGKDNKARPMPKALVRMPSPGKTEVSLPGIVWNTGFPGQLCLDPATATKLGLARFEIPGVVTGSTITPLARKGTALDYPARRAWVVLRFDGVTKPMRIQATIPRVVRAR